MDRGSCKYQHIQTNATRRNVNFVGGEKVERDGEMERDGDMERWREKPIGRSDSIGSGRIFATHSLIFSSSMVLAKMRCRQRRSRGSPRWIDRKYGKEKRQRRSNGDGEDEDEDEDEDEKKGARR